MVHQRSRKQQPKRLSSKNLSGSHARKLKGTDQFVKISKRGNYTTRTFEITNVSGNPEFDVEKLAKFVVKVVKEESKPKAPGPIVLTVPRQSDTVPQAPPSPRVLKKPLKGSSKFFEFGAKDVASGKDEFHHLNLEFGAASLK
jgi:hypothetical protein